MTSTKQYFKQKIKENGYNYKGLDHGSTENQHLRFKQMRNLFYPVAPSETVLDYGCGFGEFSPYCKFLGYTGYDSNELAIEEAKKRFPGHEFISDINKEYNWIVANGCFYVRVNQLSKMQYMKRIQEMWSACVSGIGFTLSSNNAPTLYSEQVYFSVEEVYNFCRENFSNNIVINHSYMDHEFMVFVYKYRRI